MTSLVVRKMINGRTLKLKLVPVVRKVIGGGVLQLERVQVICPACGQQVEAIATDGRVKGYCTVAEQYVEFPITPGSAAPMGSQGTADTRAKISATMKKRWQDPEYWAKQIATHIGRHPAAEARAKMSAVHTGKHLTAEHKAKISAAITRWHNTKRGGG